MTFTTVNDLVAGILTGPSRVYKDTFTGEGVGGWHTFRYLTGSPGAASAPSGGLAGTARSATVTGQIPVPASVGGKEIRLARLSAGTTAGVASVLVVDRLWDNSGFTITTTTAQTVNSVAFPARDTNGLTAGTDVMVGIEVSTVTGNGSPVTNTTMSYTNETGVAGRSATIASFPATGVAGTFVPFSLQAGDRGVQSIQTLTLGTSYVSGTIHLVAYREIADVGIPVANTTYDKDAFGLGLPKIFDSSVLELHLWLSATTVGVTRAQLTFAQN